MSNIMDMVRQKKQSIQAQSGRKAKTHKPQPGKNTYRILPGWRKDPNDPLFYHDFGQHFVKGIDGTLKAVYVCTEKTYGKPCPICEQVNEALAQGVDETVAKALGEAKSKGRVLMNALHLSGDDKTTPVILDLTPTTFEKVLEVMEEYGDITQLSEEGVNLIITRSGQGLNTEYTVMAAAKRLKIPEKVMDGIHDLDEYVKQEYDEGRNKAIAAVSSVSGMLPAPSSSAGAAAQPSNDVPKTSVFDATDEEIPFESDEPAGDPVVEPEEVSLNVDAEATAGDDDDELEAMLAELEG